MSDESLPVKVGAWRGGWLLARASWTALKLDKELIAFPVMSGIYALIWTSLTWSAAAFIYVSAGGDLVDLFSSDSQALTQNWGYYLYGLVTLLGVYVISNYFTAALIASAIHRFTGGNPTISYGLKRARERAKPIILFSLLQGTVGWLLSVAEERLPLVGKITAFIADITWQLATFFAVPVIVMSEEPVGPVGAVKKSAAIFRNTWKNNFTGGLALGLVAIVVILAWMALTAGLTVLALNIHLAMLFVSIPVSLILLFIIVSILGALNGIFIAALYHYATTGQSPVEFDKDLLQAAFQPKKKLFGKSSA